MKVKVRWSVTEEHEVVIDVDADDVEGGELTPEAVSDYLTDDRLAEEENNTSYFCTTDRDRISWVEVTDE